MFLGYQNNKVKYYVEQPLNPSIYNVDSWEETNEEYILDGEEYVLKNEEWEERQAKKEKERIAKLSLTKREVFLALYKAKGLTPEMIRSQITDTEALIEFDYATEYFRFNPLIDKIGLMLGYSSEDIDYLFEHKELPMQGLDNIEIGEEL